MTYPGPARAAARSLASSSSSAPGAPAARRIPPPRPLLAAIALVALTGAGCSNAPAGTGGGGAGGENAAAKSSPNPDPNGKASEFAQCMRENGVEDFPDPGADGTIQYSGGADQPEFESAQNTCRHLRPEKGGTGERTPGGGG